MNHPMTLPQTILKRLEKVAAASRRTPQSIVNQAISDRLEYEEWLLGQIDAGLEDIKAGRTLSDAAFWKKLETLRHGRKKAA